MKAAAIMLAAVLAAVAFVSADAQSYGYGSMGSYGYGGSKAACTVSFNFTSHSDSTYKCGSGTCQVVQVSVSNLQPYPIPYGWTLTLAKSSWTDAYSVNTWWNCANVKLAGGLLTLDSNAQWQKLAANGGNAEGLGYIMEGTSADAASFTADKAMLNGRTCAIV